MVKRRGDGVSRALAGSLLAASEEDWSTVSVFKNRLFGNANFYDRGMVNKAVGSHTKSH